MLPPREVPDRHEFYLGLALFMASKSKDPSTQCAAVIIDQTKHKPLGWGYNGPPKKIDDKKIDWSRPNKYKFIKHAEDNAIKHCSGDPKGSTIYVTARPCPACMLDIVDAEIAEVVYYPFKSNSSSSMVENEEFWKDTQEIAELGGVKLIEFSRDLFWIDDRFSTLKKMGIL